MGVAGSIAVAWRRGSIPGPLVREKRKRSSFPLKCAHGNETQAASLKILLALASGNVRLQGLRILLLKPASHSMSCRSGAAVDLTAAAGGSTATRSPLFQLSLSQPLASSLSLSLSRSLTSSRRLPRPLRSSRLPPHPSRTPLSPGKWSRHRVMEHKIRITGSAQQSHSLPHSLKNFALHFPRSLTGSASNLAHFRLFGNRLDSHLRQREEQQNPVAGGNE